MAKKTFTTLEVNLGASRHGCLQPELSFGFPAKTHWREEHATLLEAAARVERATPPAERWIVGVCQEYNTVYLELGEADQAEAARGMAVLTAVAAKLQK